MSSMVLEHSEKGARFTATRTRLRRCQMPMWEIRRTKGTLTVAIARISVDEDPQAFLDRYMETRQ